MRLDDFVRLKAGVTVGDYVRRPDGKAMVVTRVTGLTTENPFLYVRAFESKRSGVIGLDRFRLEGWKVIPS